MLNTSLDFRLKAADGAPCLVQAQLVLADGRRLDLTGDDFMLAKGFTFEQQVSSVSSFDIGAAIIGSLTCTLNNWGRRFDAYDLEGARILPQVGIELDGGVEWLRKGTYWVDAPDALSETITLTCLDSLCRFDVPYSKVATRYPATARTVVLDLCSRCGVPLLNAAFANSDVVFKQRPSDDATCRDVLSWAAQATGNFVRMTADDRLELAWYDPSVFDEEDWLDGEDFDDGSPYASGSKADGGNFTDYSSGAKVDGGTFDTGKIVPIYAYSSSSVRTDDVTVTGIRVTASDEKRTDGGLGAKGETVLVGAEGYVLEVSGNPLIARGTAADFARRIANQCAGLVFRPFDVSCIGDPRVEAGDPAIITDRYQNAHRGYLTSVTYKVGAFAAYSCSAESGLRNSSAGSSALTRAVAGLEDGLRAEMSEREAAVQRLNDDLMSAPGVYTTKKTANGATTYYVHDKRKLEDSQFVWMLNSAGLGISVSGLPKTGQADPAAYSYGLDKWGNAILNTVYAIGLNANYIKTGAIRVAKGASTIFEADFAKGTVSINPTVFSWSSTYSSLTTNGMLTVKGGNIAGFTLASNAIYKGRSGLAKNAKGVYLGTDGIALGGDNSIWTKLTNGYLCGGRNTTQHGYLCFTLGKWRNYGAGAVLSTSGTLYLGCKSLVMCDPLGSGPESVGTILNPIEGMTKSFEVVRGLDVSMGYLTAKKWMFYDSGNKYLATAYPVINKLHLTRKVAKLRFERGLLTGYTDMGSTTYKVG